MEAVLERLRPDATSLPEPVDPPEHDDPLLLNLVILSRLFGNPKSGTPLMQASQTMGLALPMKVLVWQDADAKVWIGYDAPADVAARHEVPGDHPVLAQVTKAMQGLAAEAIKP